MTAGGPDVALVIFDCDGVLVDSEWLVTRIEAEMLNPLGVDLTAEQIAHQFVGLSEGEMHRRIEEQWPGSLPATFAADKSVRVFEAIRDELEAIDGIAATLDALSVPCCVASSSSPERIRLSLDRTGLLEHFDPHVFSASEVEHGKPAPDIFLHAASRMGVAPERCIVIEDSPHGVVAGRAAGMPVIGFTGGRHCTPAVGRRLVAAGAGDVADTSTELREVLAAFGACAP